MIDLRSDTCSRPSDAMRAAMLGAPVGDDVYADDPTVRKLEERVAALLGKEDAAYMVTGTMTNQVAVRVHTEPGDQVLMEAQGHLFVSEGGAPAALSGVSVQQIPGVGGVVTAAQIRDALPQAHAFTPQWLESPARLLCLENTHNVAGGTVWPLDVMHSTVAAAREGNLATHLDGARLWNACSQSGVEPAEYAAPFDTVSVCFSKGLGAPMGSALVGSRALIDRARRFKQLFGGGFRQAGIMAAGALYALEHNRDRLIEDQANAGRFADALSNAPGIELNRSLVQTNIARFSVTQTTAAEFVDRCYRKGLHLLPSGRSGVRAVFHLDVSQTQTEQALNIACAAAVGGVVSDR